MIYNYVIREKNNEQILYLYFDFDDEFARLKWKEKAKRLEDKVKKFIQENKIDFKGTTVAIVTSGIVVGTLLLNQPNDTPNVIKNDNYTVTISEQLADKIANPNVEIPKENTVIEQIENSEVQDKQETNIQVEKTNEQEKNSKQEANQTAQNISQPIKQEAIPIQTVVPEQSKQESIPEDNQVEENIQNETYVTIHRTNGQVITLELEEYIIGVVGAEMPAAFSEHALMSQAIIARTYALKAIQRNITLTDSSSTQNYKSNDQLQTLWGSNYNFYYDKIKNAVESTKSLYLTYNGQVIEAVYHSTSNGTTENAKYVWGNSFPYLVSVESTYDSSNPSFIKEQFLSYQDLTTKLGFEINADTNFDILSKTTGNRVEIININNQSYTGVQIRNLLGLRSTDFEIQKTDIGIIFRTKGYGHGVGMSQYGANGMAKAGYNYEQILKHYYSGVTISQI